MINVVDLLNLVRTNPLEAERSACLKWACTNPDLQSAWDVVQALLAYLDEGKLAIADVSLLMTYALAALTAYPGLSRTITMTALPASTELTVYADYPSPFEKTPARAAAAANPPPDMKGTDLHVVATKLVTVVESVYVASVAQAEAHRAALHHTVQGLQVLSGVLRAYAVALLEVLPVMGAGARCAGFLQNAVQGLAHRATALSVAHATLLHVARQAHLPAVALRVLRPVLNQTPVGGMRPLPVMVDVDGAATGTALHDYAAFYVEAGLFCASQGLWAEATQCVYNVVALHEGECFGSTWKGTHVGALAAAANVNDYATDIRKLSSGRRRDTTGEAEYGAERIDNNEVNEDDAVAVDRSPFGGSNDHQPPRSWSRPAVALSGHQVPAVIPLETRSAGISLRAIPSGARPGPYCPSPLEVQLAYDLYVQAIKLCDVCLVIAHGGGQPARVLQLLDRLDGELRQRAKGSWYAPELAADEEGRDRRGSHAVRPEDPPQGLHSAADNADFTRSHMDIARIVLAGTRLDAFTASGGDRGLESGDHGGQIRTCDAMTAHLMAHLAPYRALLRCAARRDLIGWTRHVRQLDTSETHMGVLLVTATTALRQHVLIDLAHTYEVVYLRDILLRIATHPSDPQPADTATNTATMTTAPSRRADINEVESALQLLRETHEAGLIEFHLERPEAALAARDAGQYVVSLSVPPLTVPGVAGGARPPHGYFCLAPRLHEVDLKPSLVERVEYLQNLRGHVALVKELDYMRWQTSNAEQMANIR